jgi:predicted nucleotide-binding protein
MRVKTTTGMAVATAAAMLFGTGLISTAFAGEAAKEHCAGVNACKGQSACKSANNACKGQNSCKGKGFLEMSKKECKAAQEKMKEDAGK